MKERPCTFGAWKRTRVLAVWLALSVFGSAAEDAAQSARSGQNSSAAARPGKNSGQFRLRAKELLVPYQQKRPVATGFVAYVDKKKPVLMHCYGWEDYSDGYDDYAVAISCDNGKTWSKPEMRWKSMHMAEGRMPLRLMEGVATGDRPG